ncbi:MAG: mannonate dehydratase [Gammaproteobacteria bacterium]|nr:mannonate dehydratase [Gammaproteobacteria bacterium]
MQQAWRWFGPTDPVPLEYIRQAGASEIVSSLHDIPTGSAWTAEAIARHQALIHEKSEIGAPLNWSVVESIPVHDAIKRGTRQAGQYVEAYIDSLRALSKSGIRTVCYNFMPLLDWTRTDLSWPLPSGGRTLRFDATAFAAFDLFILKRPGAEVEYSEQRIKSAESFLKKTSSSSIDTLVGNVLAGLPGGTTDSHSLEGFQSQLDRYREIDSDDLRENLVDFLRQISPVAEDLGMRLAIHPDDPPRPLLGLPRVVSSRDDLAALFKAVPSPANGLTLCTGSFGVRPDNDLPAMAKEFSDRIFFAHLRGTRREDDPDSFHEAEHLNSDVDMLGVIRQLIGEEQRRKNAGDSCSQIPFRADHGHQILDDLEKQGCNPGYTAIGRLKGLAEVRGVITAIEDEIKQ